MKTAIVPIRDTYADDMPIVFALVFYGLSQRDLCLIQIEGPLDPNIGSAPIRRALERRGFDSERFRPFIWDIMS